METNAPEEAGMHGRAKGCTTQTDKRSTPDREGKYSRRESGGRKRKKARRSLKKNTEEGNRRPYSGGGGRGDSLK